MIQTHKKGFQQSLVWYPVSMHERGAVKGAPSREFETQWVNYLQAETTLTSPDRPGKEKPKQTVTVQLKYG